MLSKMRDIFKVGPSPFQIGSSFKPVKAQPIKVSRRRPSDASEHELIESTIEADRTRGVDESEDEDAAQDYITSSDIHDAPHGVERDRVIQQPPNQNPKPRKGAAKPGSRKHLFRDSTITKNTTEEVAKGSLAGSREAEVPLHSQTRRPVVTPPPTLNRKRQFPHSGDKHDKPTSKKRKEFHKPDSTTPLEEKLGTIEKTHHKPDPSKSTEMSDVPTKENLEQTSTGLSKQQRREGRQRRKEEKAERRMKKMERKKREIGMHDTTKSAAPQTLTGSIRQDPTITINEEYESPELEASVGDGPQFQGSQDSLLDEDNTTTTGVPSRRNGAHDPEIPATQESQTLSRSAQATIPQSRTRSDQPPTSEATKNQNVQSEETFAREHRTPENLSSPQSTLEPDGQTNHLIKPPESKKSKAKPAKPSSSHHLVPPKANRRRQFLSAEKIIDSSEDELQEPELHGSEEEAWEQGPNLRSKRRKVSDLNKLRPRVHFAERTSPPDSPTSSGEEEEEEMEIGKATENKSRRQRRPFTAEDDEKLHRIIAQFKKRERISDEKFLQLLHSRAGYTEFIKDIKLEDWKDRRIDTVLRRARSLLGTDSVGQRKRQSSGKGIYTPEENAAVDRAVQEYRKVEGLSKDELAELLREDMKITYSRRKTRELCKEIANKLPGRNILSVTRHILKRFSGEKYSGEWSNEDDVALRKLVAQFGTRWTAIAAHMARPAELVRLRYRDYVSLGTNRKAGTWDSHDAMKLYEIVLVLLRDSNWTEGEGFNVEVVSKYLDWGAVSVKMGDRSRLQCRSKWAILDKWQNQLQETNDSA